MARRRSERALLVAVVAALGVLAAGCGGSKAPSVASLGPTASTTTTTSGSGAGTGVKQGPGAFVKFVSCMNEHGVQAQLGQGGQGVTINGGNPNSPLFQAAQKACQKLLPGGGPQPLSPAQAAQNMKSLLTMAQCMRKHGLPNFPDPNSQGVFAFGPGSGADPGSSQFQTAMQACRPGNGTRISISVKIPGGGRAGSSVIQRSAG